MSFSGPFIGVPYYFGDLKVTDFSEPTQVLLPQAKGRVRDCVYFGVVFSGTGCFVLFFLCSISIGIGIGRIGISTRILWLCIALFFGCGRRDSELDTWVGRNTVHPQPEQPCASEP